jgi:hypothetical protein
MGITKILMVKKPYTIVPEDEEITISSCDDNAFKMFNLWI